MTNHASQPYEGILTHDEILIEITQNRLIRYGVKDNVEACSYDMTIGTIFVDGQIINFKDHPNKQIVLRPGEIICMLTKEELILPKDVSATAFPINEQSSKGLLVLNPGHVDPGYEGPLTIKAINLRKVSYAIVMGTPIFTVIFAKLPKDTSKPYVNNMTREKKEQFYHARDVESSPKSIGEILTLEKSAPFPTRDEVREAIRDHWMSRAMLIASIIAAFAAGAALLLQVYKGAQINAQPVVLQCPQLGASAGPRVEKQQRNELDGKRDDYHARPTDAKPTADRNHAEHLRKQQQRRQEIPETR